MLTLEREQTLATLKAIVEERPDYVYTDENGRAAGRGSAAQCWYFTSTGEPACVVGHVLARLGMKKEDITDATNEGGLVSDLVRRGYISGDQEAITLLDRMQSKQDAGVPWGEAYRAALLDQLRGVPC